MIKKDVFSTFAYRMLNIKVKILIKWFFLMIFWNMKNTLVTKRKFFVRIYKKL